MATTKMAPHDLQETNEYRYVRKHINKYIRKWLQENTNHEDNLNKGVLAIQNWINHTLQDTYASKANRLQQVQQLNLKQLVEDMLVLVASLEPGKKTTLVSVVARAIQFIGLDSNKDSALTLAEICAVLGAIDFWDLVQPDKRAEMFLINNIVLPDGLYQAIERSEFPPPMVCVPQTVKSNYQSPYLTFNESQISGGGQNDHDGEICLDVINTQNQVALRICEKFIQNVAEYPKKPPQTPEEQQQWAQFLNVSQHMYDLMLVQGNEFWMTYRVDGRGRLYAKGYHINPQGAPYKKAMLEFSKGEYVTGVPMPAQPPQGDEDE